MKNIAVFISGGGTNLQAIIDDSKKSKFYKIGLVISNKENAYGLTRAKKANIPNLYIKSKETNVILKTLKDHKIDYIVLAGYLAIVDPQIIKKYKNKIINIHPSLIPSFCGPGMYGLHVHEAVIKSGVKVSGCTTHFVNEEVDGGAIIIQHCVPVDYGDTAESLQKKILKYEHQTLVKSVNLLVRQKIKVINGRTKILK